MQTGNELLQGILHVVGRIEANQKKTQKEISTKASGVKDIVNISSALSSFSRVKPKTAKRFLDFSRDILQVVKESNKGKDFQSFSEGLINISSALPNLVSSLTDLGKLKSRRVDMALNSLTKLYNLMHDMGDNRSARRVERATKLFEELGTSLMKIARPMRILSNFLTYVGLSFVVFAGGIVAGSVLLGMSSPLGVVGALVGTVAVLVGVIGVLALANKFLKPGIDTVKGIGKGFFFLAAGLTLFAFGIVGLAAILGTGGGMQGIGKAFLVIGGVVLLSVGMFALLGAADKWVNKGTKVVKGMGAGLFILIGGVFLFTLGLIGTASLLSQSANPAGIAMTLGAIALTIGVLVGVFWLLGKAAKQVAMGTLVAILVAGGIMVIGL